MKPFNGLEGSPGSGLPVREGAFKGLFVATPQNARNWATNASHQIPQTLDANP
jgi:hypothetical protein